MNAMCPELRPAVFQKLRYFAPPQKPRDWNFDSIKTVRIGGESAIRHILHLTSAHVGINTLSMGRIGTHDVGRVLVVDVYQDGNRIDVIADKV